MSKKKSEGVLFEAATDSFTPIKNKPDIRDVYNAHRVSDTNRYEHPKGISLTVPDESKSVKELLDLHARGLPLGGAKVPIYEPDNDMPDPRTLDLEDRHRLAVRYTEELRELREKEEKLKHMKGDAEKAAREKERENMLDELAKKLAEKQKPA